MKVDRATRNALRNVHDGKPGRPGRVSLRTLECLGFAKYEPYVVHADSTVASPHVTGGWSRTDAGLDALGVDADPFARSTEQFGLAKP